MWERLGGVSRWGPRHEALLAVGTRALFPLALVEALVGRAMSGDLATLPRTPASAALGGALSVLVGALATVVLALIVWSLRARVHRLPAATEEIAVLSIGFVAYAVASSAVASTWIGVGSRTLFLSTTLIVMAADVAPERNGWARALYGLLALVYGASWIGSIPGNEAGGWSRIAEAAAFLVPVPLFAVARVGRSPPEMRTAMVAAGVVVGAFAIVALLWPSETAAVALYGLGFSLFPSLPLTAAALGLAVLGVGLLLFEDPFARRRAYGIGLVMTAGINLLPTHVPVLALVGLLLWSLREHRPEPVPAVVAAPAPVPAKAAD